MALAVHSWDISESKLHRAEKREERAARVDIFETLARLQGGSTAGKNDVFCQRRAVLDANAEVFADGVMDWRLKKKKFQRLGAFESEIVEIGEAAQFWRDFKVCTGVREKNPGIYEIGLAFFFACAERRKAETR